MAQKNITAVGRRKSSNARVIITPAANSEKTEIVVNGKTLEAYFPVHAAQGMVTKPVEVSERVGKYDFKVNVQGGGTMGQAGAVLHGVARALEKVEPELRAVLKKAGLLTRDPREVERKKPGKHKARKSTQFSKR